MESHFRTWSGRRAKNGVDEGVVLALITKSFENGFSCCYCGVKLNFHDPRPGWRWAALEHKTSRWKGGTNIWDNLAVSCHRCNCVKGTLGAEDFENFIRAIRADDPDLLERLMTGWFDSGRLAQAIERDRSGGPQKGGESDAA